MCLLLGHYSQVLFLTDSAQQMSVSKYLLNQLQCASSHVVALHALNLVMENPKSSAIVSAECLSLLICHLPQ